MLEMCPKIHCMIDNPKWSKMCFCHIEKSTFWLDSSSHLERNCNPANTVIPTDFFKDVAVELLTLRKLITLYFIGNSI